MNRATIPDRAEGFTLIELMVTIAILAILVAVAAPSIDRSIRQNRIDADTEKFQTAISYARSEADKRAATVSIVPSAAGWRGGWRIITDDGATNPNCALDAAQGEVTLRVQDQLSATSDVLFAAAPASSAAGITCAATMPGPPACLSFNKDRAAVFPTGAFLAATLCVRDSATPTTLFRAVTINRTGQPYLSKVQN